jgi:tetratricopeptide (TPR) repeat protein
MGSSGSAEPGRVVRFASFEMNLRTGELWKYGFRLRLGGQPTQILILLLEKSGQVVTRDELRRRLWSDNTFVEFESGLNNAVRKLRAALGDSGDRPHYIETVPRVGYRFIAPIGRVPGTAPPPAEASLGDDRSRAPVVTEWASNHRGKALWGIAIVLIALVGAYFARSALRNRLQPHPKNADEIHNSIASAGPAAVPSRFGEAQDLYLKGMYFWNKRNVAGFQQAIECFRQATNIDPNYALAYVGLANSYTLLTSYSPASPSLYIPQARAAVARAIKLDPNLAEAHTAMALIAQNHDWDWQGSEKEYRRAIELNPNYATGHQWYAEHLMWLGRFDEALSESQKAQQLDPLSLIIAADQGAILYFSRRYDRAIEQFRSVLRKDPNFVRAGAVMYAYVESGRFPDAFAEAEMRRRLYGEEPLYWSRLAYIYGRSGQTERAGRELQKLENLSRQEEPDPVTMVWAHLGVGDKEEALADLERAYAEHSNIMVSLKVEPAFDPLRSDPRFQDLLRRVHLIR